MSEYFNRAGGEHKYHAIKKMKEYNKPTQSPTQSPAFTGIKGPTREFYVLFLLCLIREERQTTCPVCRHVGPDMILSLSK